jgi:hypothetical protein
MSRNKIILLIGILVAIMPFLGFPTAWKTIFYLLFGAILIIVAVVGHVERRSVTHGDREQIVTEVYVEKTTIQG